MFGSGNSFCLSFEKICRACLQYSDEMNNLFEGNLVEMFRSCSSIEVCDGDSLPNFICQQCLNHLNKSFNFKQLCLQSDQILRANIELGYLPHQTYEVQPPEASTELNSSNILEAEVIFANLPEDETSSFAEKNAESIMQFAAQPEEEEVYMTNIDLEPECNLIDSDGLNKKIFFAESDSQNLAIPMHLVENNTEIIPIHSPIVPFKCEVCAKEFPKEDDLEVHSSVHETDKFQCKKCMKIFTKLQTLRRHVKIHYSIKNHGCNICKKKFTEACALDKHILRHHTDIKPTFKCPTCEKEYNSNWNLRRHIKFTHNADKKKVNPRSKVLADGCEKKFGCPSCEKVFRFRSNLTDHLKMHEGKKPFQCEICHRGFVQSSNYNLHMRRHRGVKPFKCPQCDASFASSSKRLMHFRVNHEQRELLKCDICNKTLLTKNGWLTHKKIHEGDLRHPCPFCPKRFACPQVRNRHMDVHSKSKCFNCNICEEVFDKISELTKHKRVHDTSKKKPTAEVVQEDSPTFFELTNCFGFSTFNKIEYF